MFGYHAWHKADLTFNKAAPEDARSFKHSASTHKRMFKILGGDKKEYGPVTAEQVREWIVQRRAGTQTLVQGDGVSDWTPLGQLPEFADAFTGLPPPPPAYVTTTVNEAASDNAVSVMIPYKNPKALIGYYLGIFSLIPCLGLPLGIAALVLGVLGLRAAKVQPNARGKVHAWVAIVLGGLCALGNMIGIVLVFVGTRS